MKTQKYTRKQLLEKINQQRQEIDNLKAQAKENYEQYEKIMEKFKDLAAVYCYQKTNEVTKNENSAQNHWKSPF